MHDKDVFTEATRLEDWTHLAGNGAAARARSAGLRRTRHAGIAGATAAVAVGAAAIAGTFGGGTGGTGGSTVTAGSVPVPTKVTSSPAAPAPRTTTQAPAKGTMGALFQQWKSCPDSELTVVNALPQDPPHLQQAWRDACRRDVATLTALLPGYDVSPAVASIGLPKGDPRDLLGPAPFDDPSFVVPAGYTPTMGPAIYRIAGKDGVTTKVFIHAYAHDDKTKPATGEAVTLPNGLQAWLTLGTDLTSGRPGYEIYILSQGRTFYLFTTETPNYDFKALVTSPRFADMAAKALAEPET